MRTPPTNWTTLMSQPHETETRLDIAGVSYYGYDGESGIWSCETRPMLFDKLSVGNCCSATINLVLAPSQHRWKKYNITEQFVWNVYEQETAYKSPVTFTLNSSNTRDIVFSVGVQKLNGSFGSVGSTMSWSGTISSVTAQRFREYVQNGYKFAYHPYFSELRYDLEPVDFVQTSQTSIRMQAYRLSTASEGSPTIVAGALKDERLYSSDDSAYPNGGAYNDVYTTKRSRKERYKNEFIEDVYSDDAEAYPQNGEKDGYWYTYEGIVQRPIPTMAKMELYVRLHGGEIESETRYAVDDAGHSGMGMYVVPGEGEYIRFSEYLLKNDDELVFPQDAGKIYMTMENYEEVQAAIKEKFIVFGDGSGEDTTYYYAKSSVTVSPIYAGLNVSGIYNDYTVKEYNTAYTDWVRKGIYYIDTREWDAQHEFLTITGYDAMLKTEQDFIVPPVHLEDWPKTDEEIVEEICDRIGVELDTRTVLDKGYEVQVPAVSSDGKDSDTIREVLGWIGAMYGGNWCITDEGKLRLVPLVPTQTVSVGTDALDLTTTPAYDALGVVHLVVSEDAEYIAPQSGGTGRSIEISCPWGTQAMANNILTAIGGYVYQPLTVTTATEANPLWEIGDGVTVNGYTSVIASMPTAFGLKYTADIEAPESEEINHEYPYQDKGTRDIERKIAQSSASLKIGIDAIESIVKGIAQPYVEGTRYTQHAIVYKDGKYYSCNVEAGQTSSTTWVASEWTEQSSGALSSIIKQTMDSLTFSVSSGINQSTITIKANGVDVASPVVRFSRIEADSVAAYSDISAPNILGGKFYDEDEDVSVSFDRTGSVNSLIFRDENSNEDLVEFYAGVTGRTVLSELYMAGYNVISANDVIEGAELNNILSIDTSDGTLKIYTTGGRYWEISGSGIEYCDKYGNVINWVVLGA